jgi:hypothetical protein
MALHINDIRAKYNAGEYTCKVNIPAKVKPDHIFDEELSVRRNRELAMEHNDNVDQMRRDKSRIQSELDQQLTDDVVEYIKEYYELDDRQARIVEGWVYREKHAFMCDYFSSVDSFAEFADILVNSGKDD